MKNVFRKERDGSCRVLARNLKVGAFFGLAEKFWASWVATNKGRGSGGRSRPPEALGV